MRADTKLSSPKIGVLIVAYNAESTLANVLDRIPKDFAPQISAVLVCDDASHDQTHDAALEYQRSTTHLPLHILRHPINLGYGGNQKAGYVWAQELGLDFIVLLHGDGQYAPELLPEMVAPLLNGSAEAVFGSRMMEQGAARRGGMPLYKLIGNKILTRWENAMAGTHLSEWHSGYRAYSVSALQKLALERNSDGFDFDTQIILQLHASGARIMEIPIPTYYGDEICHVDGLKYGRQVMVETFRYRLHKMGLGSGKHIPQNHAYEIKTSADSSHGVLLRQLSKKSPCRVLDVGCSDGALGERIRALGHVVVGIDVECHELVKGRLDNFIQADLDQGLPKDIPGLFDVVLCADVVEHVRQPDVLLNELRAVVAPGGSVLVSIPNFGHWYPRVRTMFGLFDYDRRGILDRTHVRFFTHRSFKRLAQNAGYSVQRVACTGFPFDVLSRGNTKIPKFIIAPLRVIDMALVKVRPPFFAYQFIYELKS